MIIDLQKFQRAERPFWEELDVELNRLENDRRAKLDLPRIQRLQYLHERAAADLARVQTFSAEPELRRYLESLVARGYAEIHSSGGRRRPLRPLEWFFRTLPGTFRRHVAAFWLSVAVTLAGCLFGGLAQQLDPGAKPILMPFDHLHGSPAERVAAEERETDADWSGKTSFSATLMTHNTRVSILTLALGLTCGIGTLVVLFSNGVSLGAVAVDYVAHGQTRFLLGWLMPHGVIEIPAILIAGQAGLVLAGALLGRGQRLVLADRLRAVTGDLVTLIAGVAILLVWAGLVESFLSQFHQPVLPYTVKIAFGGVELALLVVFLTRAGRHARPAPGTSPIPAVQRPRRA